MKASKIILKTALTALVAFGTVQSTNAMMDPEFKVMTQSRLGVVATQLKARAKTVDETTILTNMHAELQPIFLKDSNLTITSIRDEIDTTAHAWAKDLRAAKNDVVFAGTASGLLGRADAFAINAMARVYVGSPADDQRNTFRRALQAQIAGSVVAPIVFGANIDRKEMFRIDRIVRTQIVDDVVDNFVRHLSANAHDVVLDGAVVTVDDLLAAVPGGGLGGGVAIPGAKLGEVTAGVLTQVQVRQLIQARNDQGITHYPQDDTLGSLMGAVRAALMHNYS